MHVPGQEFDRTLSSMMLEWCLHKDIRRIAQCLIACSNPIPNSIPNPIPKPNLNLTLALPPTLS